MQCSDRWTHSIVGLLLVLVAVLAAGLAATPSADAGWVVDRFKEWNSTDASDPQRDFLLVGQRPDGRLFVYERDQTGRAERFIAHRRPDGEYDGSSRTSTGWTQSPGARNAGQLAFNAFDYGGDANTLVTTGERCAETGLNGNCGLRPANWTFPLGGAWREISGVATLDPDPAKRRVLLSQDVPATTPPGGFPAGRSSGTGLTITERPNPGTVDQELDIWRPDPIAADEAHVCSKVEHPSGADRVAIADVTGDGKADLLHYGAVCKGGQVIGGGFDVWQGVQAEARFEYCRPTATTVLAGTRLRDLKAVDLDPARAGDELVLAADPAVDGATVITGRYNAAAGACSGVSGWRADDVQPDVVPGVRQLLVANLDGDARRDVVAVRRPDQITEAGQMGLTILVTATGDGRFAPRPHEVPAHVQHLSGPQQSYDWSGSALAPGGADDGVLLAKSHGYDRVRPTIAPTATITPSTLAPRTGQELTLTPEATSVRGLPRDARIAAVEWDFGDGTPDVTTRAPDLAVKHTFTSAAQRTVTATIDTEGGDTTTAQLVVDPREALQASIRSVDPEQPAAGAAATLTAAASGGDGTYTYEWRLGDDPAVLGTEPTFTTTQTGRREVRLRVRDGDAADPAAQQQDASRSVRWADPLRVRLAGPSQVQACLAADGTKRCEDQATFTATHTGGLPGHRFAFDTDGDGDYETDDGTASFTKAFKEGTVQVGVRVRDEDGAPAGETATATRELLAYAPGQEPPFRARAEVDPEIPAAGEPFALDASSTRGGTGPLTYRWDLDADPGFERGPSPSPRLELPGRAASRSTARLQVTDQDGTTSVASVRIDVADPPRAALAASATDVETGDDVRLDASGSTGGVGAVSYAFDPEGDGSFEAAGPDAVRTIAFGAAGARTPRVRVTDERGRTSTAGVAIDVAAKLEAALAIRPDEVETQQQVLLDGSVTTGGSRPLRYRFDLDGDGTYEKASADGTEKQTYERPGRVAVGLQVTDQRGRVRTTRRDVDVTTGCKHGFSLKVARLRTASPDGCFKNTGTAKAPVYTTSQDVVLNELPIDVADGAKVTYTPPSRADRGGRLHVSDAEVDVQGVTVLDGDLNWELPNAEAEEGKTIERPIFGVDLPEDAAEVLGLEISGRIAISLAVEPDGTSYTKMRANLEIPGLELGSGEGDGAVTARVGLHLDEDGLDLDGVMARVQNAKVGELEVHDVCLSYVAAGIGDDDIKGCPQLETVFGEDSDCDRDDSKSQWRGTLAVTLPFGDFGIRASGGLVEGSLSDIALGATLKRQAPIKPNVAWLKAVQAGVCLKPPPLKVTGQAEIGMLPVGDDEEAISVKGGFLYTDAHDDDPWEMKLAGNISVFDHEAANAYAKVNGDGQLGFGYAARMQFPSDDLDLASIKGSFEGLVDAKRGQFSVEAAVRACVFNAFCLGGEAIVGTKGVAACATLFEVPYPVFDVGLFYVNVSIEYLKVRGGFGYSWGGGVDVMAASCDVGKWRAGESGLRGRPSTKQALNGPREVVVKPGEGLLTLRANGIGAPPQVRLRGPDGSVIEPPAMGGFAEAPGKWRLLEDPQTASTGIQVAEPAPGTWTVEPVGLTQVRSVDRADFVRPTAVGGRLTRRGKRGRRLTYVHTPEPGTTVTFVEESKDVRQVLGTAKRGACPDELKVRGGADADVLECGELDFRPAYGKGGRRTVYAEIARDGKPVDKRPIASYRAPSPRRVKQVRRVRLARDGSALKVSWARTPVARRYEAAISTSSGVRTLRLRTNRCTLVRVPGVPRGSSAKVSLRGIDAHGNRGPRVRLKLRGGVDGTGARAVRGAPRRC